MRTADLRRAFVGFVVQRRAALLGLAPAVAVGTLLRLWRIHQQVLCGDELHAPRAALAMSLREILSTYQIPDNSIPLTALYRLAMDAGLRMSELHFRLPVLAAGLLTLVVLPLALASRLGRTATTVFAWLLALSPMLTLYSRIVRSYAPMTLFAVCAVVAFYRWQFERRRAFGFAYVLLASASVYLHLVAGTFVFAPFLFAVGCKLLRKPAPSWRALATLFAATAGLTAALLAPPLASLSELVSAKHQPMTPDLSSLWAAACLVAGSRYAYFTALFLVVAAFGLARLYRRDPNLALFTLTLVVGHLAGLSVEAPSGLWEPTTLSRYILVLLPIVLTWVAVGLDCPLGAGPRGRRAWLASAVTFLGLQFAVSPLSSEDFAYSSLTHHGDFLRYYPADATTGEPEPEDLPVPAFYLELGSKFPPGPIVELPWPLYQDLGRVLYRYQQIHHQRVIGALRESTFRSPQLALHNSLTSAPIHYPDSPARHLVVHRDLLGEERPFHRWSPADLRGLAPKQRALRSRRLVRRLRRAWGRPVYSDDLIVVWDLEQVREKGAQGRRRSGGESSRSEP